MAILTQSSSVPVTGEIKSVCVFCGSGNGADPAYALEAYGLYTYDPSTAFYVLNFRI